MKKTLLISLVIAFIGFGMSGCAGKKGAGSSTDTVSGEAVGSEEGSSYDSGQDAMGGSSLSLNDLERVYFDFNNANLRGDARDSLKRNYSILKKYSSSQITIEGHCDERGSEEYNLALGERRAESIKRYLNNLGLSSSKMSVISYGEEKPLVIGSNESSWSKNRRGEIAVK